jgi:thiamine biosynthesis lipoprotein
MLHHTLSFFFPLTLILTSSTPVFGFDGSLANRAFGTVERNALAMGTSLSVTVRAPDTQIAKIASEAALMAVAEVEERLSTWRRDSELGRLNNAEPGTIVFLSPELQSDLAQAFHWWVETEGAFDPGIASLVAAWDLRGKGREPSMAELQLARASSGFQHLVIDRGTALVDIFGFGVEEGGFGKGVALREAVRASRAAGAVCTTLNLGGQILFDGDCEERRILIAHPDHRGVEISGLKLRTGSVASSGNSERGLQVGGERRGHILDPRSGLPADDWGAVTVVASDPVAADCLSTALFVMGPERGIEWLRGWPGIEAVFVARRGEKLELVATAGLKGVVIGSEEPITFVPPHHEPTRNFID